VNLIEFHAVSKTYEGRVAVRGVSLSVTQGERLVIVGHSGCGKTTLLRLLAGFVAPDTGSITINGDRVAADGRNLKEPEERNFELNCQMRKEVLKLQQALGFTLLYVTHSPDEAFEIGTRLVVMRHGTIERMGGVEEIREYFKSLSRHVVEGG